jgi:hypothetical protein
MSDGLIQATSRTVKTMADGTLRLTIDIEPNDAQSAFMLFGQPGAPVVLARLTQEAAQASMRQQAVEPEMKGGELARMAGVFCKDSKFWDWLEQSHGKHIIDNHEEEIARAFICEVCLIESRKELDHNHYAAERFHMEIRRPYLEWKRTK